MKPCETMPNVWPLLLSHRNVPKLDFVKVESLSRYEEESYTALSEISIRPSIVGDYFILHKPVSGVDLVDN